MNLWFYHVNMDQNHKTVFCFVYSSSGLYVAAVAAEEAWVPQKEYIVFYVMTFEIVNREDY